MEAVATGAAAIAVRGEEEEEAEAAAFAVLVEIASCFCGGGGAGGLRESRTGGAALGIFFAIGYADANGRKSICGFALACLAIAMSLGVCTPSVTIAFTTA